MKKFLSLTLVLLMVLSIGCICGFSASSGKLTTDTSVMGNPGDTVSVPVYVASNPGIIGLLISITYDTDLTLLEVKNGTIFPSTSMISGGNISSQPYNVTWTDYAATSDYIGNGTLVTFVFKISDKATSGKKNITLNYSRDNTFNTNYKDAVFSVSNGYVTVNSPKVLSSVSVLTQPTKLNYYVGETLDTKGLSLTATFSNNETEKISSGFTCNPTTLSSAGTKTITVTYGNKTTTFTVSVSNDTIKSIAVKTKPTKTEYYVGETLDTKGLSLTVTFNSGKTETVTSGFTCNPTALDEVGSKTITVTYGGKSNNFTVTICEDAVKSISVKSKPSKTTYKSGDTLATTGLTLTVTYNSGKTTTVSSGFTCNPISLSTIGKQTITVTYLNKETDFSVNVNDPNAKVRGVSIDDITMKYLDVLTINPKINVDDGVKYTVKYDCSPSGIITIDKNGNITANAQGTTTVTVTVIDQNNNVVKDTCTVTVIYSFIQWIIIVFLFGWLWY